MTITEWILAMLGLIGTTAGLIVLKKSIELTKENEALKKRNKELDKYATQPLPVIREERKCKLAHSSTIIPMCIFDLGKEGAERFICDSLAQDLARFLSSYMNVKICERVEPYKVRIDASIPFVIDEKQPKGFYYPEWFDAHWENYKMMGLADKDEGQIEDVKNETP